MQIVILAGGKATRLIPLTKTIPKSMLNICGKPFFSHQIGLLKKNNIDKIIMCVGIFANNISDFYKDGKDFDISIKYSVEQEQNLLGTAGALKNAELLLEDEFFVMYGDSYLPIDYKQVFEKFKKLEKLGLITVFKNENKFDTSNIAIENSLVTIYDKSGKNKNLQYIDYGLLLLKKKTLDLLPSNTPVDLDFLFHKLIEKKELACHEIFERFYEIGSKNGIKDFENYAKQNL